MTTATARSLLDVHLPLCDASTLQRVIVDATPADTYEAIWSADFLSTSAARTLAAIAMWPERMRAWLRGEPPPAATARSARLRDMLAGPSPWVLLADEPEHGVALGLLWTPPAGGEKRPAEEFAAFDAPGFAKVGWSITVEPFGAGRTLLTTETRTHATDDLAARRFALIWPLISPFAALLRRQVLRAITERAERDF